MFSRYLLDFDTEETAKEFTEFLVIGTGIAGLYSALKASEFGQVTLLTKKSLGDSNTELAQGGIAAAIDKKDSPYFHYEDTISAGAGLCDQEAVEVLVGEGPDRVKELIDIGTNFDKIGDVLSLTREGAHSRRRILHARGDATGEEIRQALAKEIKKQKKVKVIENSFVVDLLTEDDTCRGALVIDEQGEKKVYWSKVTVLGTGGIGQVYKNTTNPEVATGDGIAMAYRAGASVMDMEFVQFHPTALFLPDTPRFLISEAVRGEGALLKNSAGERFMPRYHSSAELAPRDVVARAIINEMQNEGKPNVYLDLSPLGQEKAQQRFPNISRTCAQYGIIVGKDLVPVSPAAHYTMGGVKTSVWGETNIKGLYACGETSALGIHGANRLASNSLLDGLVFGGRIVRASKEYLQQVRNKEFTCQLKSNAHVMDEKTGTNIAYEEMQAKLGQVMWENVGIIRHEKELKNALHEVYRLIGELKIETPKIRILELANQLVVASLIIDSALTRKESRGGHYRSDYPEPNDQLWKKHIVLNR